MTDTNMTPAAMTPAAMTPAALSGEVPSAAWRQRLEEISESPITARNDGLAALLQELDEQVSAL